MSDEQELDRIAYEMSSLQAQSKQLQEQIAKLQYAYSEAESAISALKALSQIKQETWFPIGADAMIKVKIADSSCALVDVGGRVMVEKPTSEAVALLESNKNGISKSLAEFEKGFLEISRRLQALNMAAQAKLSASQRHTH